MVSSRRSILAAVVLSACFVSLAADSPATGRSSLLAFLGIAPSSSSTPSPAAAASKPNKAGKGAKDDEDGSLMEMRERVERTIEINATPEEVFEIATDFKNYPKWAGVQKIDVSEKDGHGLGKVVSMDVGMFGRHLKYTLLYTHDGPRRTKWHAIAGSIKKLVGSYEFISIGPNRTRVVYKVFVDPGFYLPAPVRMATSKMVAMCALKELKKFTERPSTKAALKELLDKKKGKGGVFGKGIRTLGRSLSRHGNMLDDQGLHVEQKGRVPVWMLCCLF